MKLYINTSDRKKIVIGIDDKRFESLSKGSDNSQMLLPFIYEVLKQNKKDIKEITEIEVDSGPGSFTGIRVGVSVAVALAFSLGVPVNGKNILKNNVEILYNSLRVEL